jgi:cytochrome c biogenesis protein CcdA
MKRFVLFALFVFLIAGALAETVPSETKVYYFYTNTCGNCRLVAQSGILERINSWENVEVIKHEVSISERSRNLYSFFVRGFNITRDGVPLVVIEQNGNFSYLMGSDNVIDKLENSIVNFEGIYLEREQPQRNLTLWLVVITALIDSINPCAFGVLLFLMAVLISMGSPRRAFKYGLIYSFVIFIVYFIAGLGIMKALGILDIFSTIRMVVGVVLIVAAMLELKDFFWEGRGPSLRIPVSTKPLIEKYVRRGTLPAIIVLGILVALVELPCTGIIYLGILSLIAEKGTLGIFYLIIYNLIFISPLLFLTWIIYRGTNIDAVNLWVQNNKKYMRLAAGIIMIVLALNFLGVI